MAVKFHINPDTGKIGACSAQTPENCKFSIISGDTVAHYETKEEAENSLQDQLSEKYGTLTTTKVARNKKTSVRNSFIKELEKKSVSEIVDFVNESAANYKQVNKIIEDRILKTRQRNEAIKRVEERKLIDPKTVKSHKRDYDDYRNLTAELVEATNDSRFLNSKVDSWTEKNIGIAVNSESHPAHSREWYEARYNTIGGSDVGTLASIHFEEEPAGYTKAGYSKIVKTKTNAFTDEDFKKENDLKFAQRKGALYRGTVWEDRIRENYAEEHPERKVYSVEGQFSHPEREWQQVNFDGLISDREDGVPNGILEIKTGSNSDIWKNGVPNNYRAQTLYYLNTTGLEYADVRALINDNEVFEYRLHKDDEVVPGSGVNMEEYITKTVEPWFNDIKARRVA